MQAGAGLDSINPYSGALSLAVPIGPAYQVGPGLSLQLRLYYSSRVWAPGLWQVFGSTPEPNMLLDGDPALGLGWRLGFGSLVEAAAGVPAAYIAGDGSAHRLYNRRIFCSTGCPALDGFFYTRDGSYLRFQYINSTSGYKMWTPDGNLTTFGQNVKGYDKPPNDYVLDFQRGRDGWHATRIENPYSDAITIHYQADGTISPCGPPTQNCWVPYQITIPSIGGSGSRTVTINMSGSPSRVANIQLPTFGGTNSTYTLHIVQHGSSLTRPYAHPSPSAPVQAYLDSIDLPASGYSYSFTYYDNGTTPTYANGAMSRQTIPTGAYIDYTYGTWTWYHANALGRPASCGYPIVQYPTGRPTLRTGPNSEPSPLTHPGLDCAAADRAAGVTRRTVNYSTLTGGLDFATTNYYQYDYGDGEPGSGATTAQSQTVVVSPLDAANNQHSTTYLFSVSTTQAISGPLVGSLLRTAAYSGDLGAQSSVPSTSSALRVQRLSYGTDSFDTNPTNPSSEAFEANRRATQSVTIFSPIAPTSPPSGKYHQIDYGFDATAGRYNSETHSGTVGNDSRYMQTDWTPDLANWKLDKPATQHLRATSGSTDFSTVANTFDSHGFITSSVTTDGAGSYGTLTHAVTPDSHGFPTSETFSNSSGSSYSRQSLTFVSGTPKQAKWNGFTWFSTNNQVDSSTGLVSMSTDPAGLSTTFTYDPLGRPLVTTPPAGDAATTITYDTTTQTTSRTADSGNKEYAWSHTIADSLGRPLKVQRKMPAGVTVKKLTRYDKQGHTIFESEWLADAASDNTTTGTSYSGFDSFHRPTMITKADSKTTSIDYSDISYPNSVWFKTVTVAGVGGGSAVTKYTSDAFGNLVKATETPEETTNWDTGYAYNPQDRLTCVKQGGTNDMSSCTNNSSGQYRSYVYDAFGFLRKENFPEKRNLDVTYSYDALGNILTESEPGSLSLNRTYDSAGRLTGVLANSIRYLTNCYDGSGACIDGNPNFVGGTYPTGKLTRSIGFNPAATPAAYFTQDFAYSDGAGRLSSKATTVNTGAIAPQTETWIYDLAGHKAKYAHPRSSGSFIVDNTYDHGFPITVRANGLPVIISTAYQPSGLLASYVAGNDTGHNVTTTIGVDPNSMARPASFATSGASQNFSSGTYSYDGAGNITSIGSDSFGYDRLSRLTSTNYSGLGSQGFSYDRFANLTSTTGTKAQTYTINTSYNQLTSNGATYDQRGNLTAIGAETYASDALDRTARYQTTAGADWKYLYDGASERLLKIPASGVTSDYVWTFRDEANRIATEYIGPTLSRDNVFLGSLLVGSYSSCSLNGPPGWTYYSSDHLGTPRLITDTGGGTLDLRKHWPYGDEASGSGTAAQRLRFAEMERDSEGNHYYDHARSLDFQLAGRFLSVDPVRGDPSNPQSFNLFKYAFLNPVRFVDPTGTDDECGSELPCVQSGVFENGKFKPSGKLVSPSFANDIRDSFMNNQLSAYLHDLASDRQIDPFFQQIFHTGIDLLQLPTDYSDPYQLFPFLLAAVGQEGGALARELGAAGEAAAGIARNTERIDSVFRTAKYRIPDGLDWTGRVLSEVKNVAKLAYTSQLRDFAAFAAQRGLRFDLYVRRTTEISGPLMRDILGGAINLRFLP